MLSYGQRTKYWTSLKKQKATWNGLTKRILHGRHVLEFTPTKLTDCRHLVSAPCIQLSFPDVILMQMSNLASHIPPYDIPSYSPQYQDLLQFLLCLMRVAIPPKVDHIRSMVIIEILSQITQPEYVVLDRRAGWKG